MTILALLLALVAQEVAPSSSRGAPTPSKPPRSLAAYDVDWRPAVDREGSNPTAPTSVAIPRSTHLMPLYELHASDLSFLVDFELPSTPAARLLAALVEEEAHAFDPTVRCIASGSTVLIDSVAGEEKHLRELLQAARSSGRERSVAVECRFLMPGVKSTEALKRAGLTTEGQESGARVQETRRPAAEIEQLLGEDGSWITLPRVTTTGATPFEVREARNVSVVTAWDVVQIEELGTVVTPRITTLDEGLHVDGTALVVTRPADRGGDRIALDLEFGELAIARPIAQEKRTIDGKEVAVQLPSVKQSSLHALFTLAPEQRVIVAGLFRPAFKAGETPRPLLLEVVARGVAPADSASQPAKDH